MAGIRKRKQLGIAGAPIDGPFLQFKTYLHQEVDSKEYAEVVKNYVKRNYTDDKAKAILAVPTWEYANSHMAGICYWHSLDNVFDGRYTHAMTYIKERFNTLLIQGMTVLATKTAVVTSRVTPVMRMQYHVYETIMEDLYGIEDKWHTMVSVKFDLYKALKIYDIKRFDEIESWVYEHLNDFKAVINKEDEQIVEAYSHLTIKVIKERITLLEGFLVDIEQMKLSKNATRKISIKTTKRKSADKQVEKLKFQKENVEFKLTSINPMRIPSKMNLYTFNTKTRQLTVYTSSSPDGLVVSGSTIKGFDKKLSYVLKLRKPSDVLPDVMKKTPKQILKIIDSIKAQKKTPSGRVNDQTIILRSK
jgi:acetolactate synthase small subunit